ncbi:hypothetical protein [Sphingomonas faeni]|uniref:hypothetical protein n=1 Tax=Sphingomonas faeni TaxID=185950 RepID=UPI003346190E
MANNVTTALNWLADTPEGAIALKGVADAGEALRKALPVKLTNDELKYVIERLWAQRATEGWDAKAHFDVQTTGGSHSAELSRIKVPTALIADLKIRDLGFVIKAEIPQPRF